MRIAAAIGLISLLWLQSSIPQSNSGAEDGADDVPESLSNQIQAGSVRYSQCWCSEQSVDEKIAYAVHVLRALVVSTELLTVEAARARGLDGEHVRAQVEILAVFKGAPALLDGVYTPSELAFCGVPLTVGREYFFFLSEGGVAEICSGTTELRQNRFDKTSVGEQGDP